MMKNKLFQKKTAGDSTPMMHEFGCVMVTVDQETTKRIQDLSKELIPDEILYVDPNDPSYGRTEDSHVTALWGIRETDFADRVAEVVAECTLDSMTIGEMSLFSTKDYDVVIFNVEGDDIMEFNKKLEAEFPDHKNTHGEYKAHLTLAYVLPGEGKKILEKVKEVDDEPITIVKMDKIHMSFQDGHSEYITL